jgi:uroporphyrinogen-III synthase
MPRALAPTPAASSGNAPGRIFFNPGETVQLLVTRPAPDNERTGRALAGYGHGVVLAPMLRMEAVGRGFPDHAYGGVIMTSANAARVIAGKRECAKLVSLPAFTVGRHTAEEARAAGFCDVHCADGDRAVLVRLLRERFDPSRGPLLHITGEDRGSDIKIPSFTVITAPIYRMIKAEHFPAAIEKALTNRQIEGVLHFSRRTAQTYVECARRAGLLARALEPVHFCLSKPVAEPLAALAAAGIRIAARPDEAALIEAVNRGSK